MYDQLPSLSAVVVPSSGAFSPSPSNMLIVAFEVALPTKVGVLSFVICRPVLCEFSCSKILPSMSRLLLVTVFVLPVTTLSSTAVTDTSSGCENILLYALSIAAASVSRLKPSSLAPPLTFVKASALAFA